MKAPKRKRPKSTPLTKSDRAFLRDQARYGSEFGGYFGPMLDKLKRDTKKAAAKKRAATKRKRGRA